MYCVNKNLPGYQTKLKMSGVQEDTFEAYASFYLEKFGRLPNLDEIPGVNSEKYIKDILKITEDGRVKNSNLKQYLGTENLDQATLNLNKIFTDKLIEIEKENDDISRIVIVDRPKLSGIKTLVDYNNVDTDIIVDILDDLVKYHGIQFKTITNKELEKWDNFPNASSLKGFIYNGEIYINVDNSTADTPIHELLHIFIGGTKFTNNKLYNSLIDKVINTQQFLVDVESNKFRTESDIAEELLVTEYAKFLTNQQSIFDNLSEIDLYEFQYNIKRILDTAIFGDISVKAIPDRQLFRYNIEQLARITNSSIIENNFIKTWKASRDHRQLNNLKSDLLKSGELKEEC